MVGDAALWELERGTVQDTSSSALTSTINSRTKDRGTVASCLQSFAFSLTVNAHLDKFGRIDPSTSTVFVGMTLGGTFGFVLDNMLGEKLSRALPLCCPSHGGVTPPGSDEGFREYLWSPQRGMKYAIGAPSQVVMPLPVGAYAPPPSAGTRSARSRRRGTAATCSRSSSTCSSPSSSSSCCTRSWCSYPLHQLELHAPSPPRLPRATLSAPFEEQAFYPSHGATPLTVVSPPPSLRSA